MYGILDSSCFGVFNLYGICRFVVITVFWACHKEAVTDIVYDGFLVIDSLEALEILFAISSSLDISSEKIITSFPAAAI